MHINVGVYNSDALTHIDSLIDKWTRFRPMERHTSDSNNKCRKKTPNSTKELKKAVSTALMAISNVRWWMVVMLCYVMFMSWVCLYVFFHLICYMADFLAAFFCINNPSTTTNRGLNNTHTHLTKTRSWAYLNIWYSKK